MGFLKRNVGMVLAMLIGATALFVLAVDEKGADARPFARHRWSTTDFDQPNGQRIMVLPEDSKSWYTTVFTSYYWQNRPHEAQLVDWMSSDPRLNQLWKQTHHNHYTNQSAIYRTRFADEVGGAMPVIVVQDSYGKVVYKSSSSNIPKTSTDLADQIAVSIADRGAMDGVMTRKVGLSIEDETKESRRPHPFKPCPPPEPCPAPAPPAEPAVPTNAGVPDIGQQEDDVSPTAIVVGFAVLAVAIGLVSKFKGGAR
jgi:hypothetical protein